MGHATASKGSPNNAPWETLNQRLNRPVSAPLQTAVLPWRYEDEEAHHDENKGPRILNTNHTEPQEQNFAT